MKPSRSSINPLAWLDNLQAWQLKRLAFLSGIRSTGTKTEIRSLLVDSLANPRLPHPHARILSVDMGVKNLAFCLLDIQQQKWSAKSIKGGVPEKADCPVLLSEWKRLDLTSQLTRQGLTQVDPEAVDSSAVSPDNLDQTSSTDDKLPSAGQANMYSPSQLSKVAYNLAAEFVRHEPDVILIERQRFRSGGAPAIQEWTVRVNMLESMLWACLETMKHMHVGTARRAFPNVFEMSPRQIGSYWLAHSHDASIAPTEMSEMEESKPIAESDAVSKTKRSLEKKDKIALARYWLRPDSHDLEVGSQILPVVSAFWPKTDKLRSPARKRTGAKLSEDTAKSEQKDTRRGDIGVVAKPGKLDDLADCLVQGVTFALWEQNRRSILAHGAS